MYRITKVLNHNTVLAVKDKSAREYLIVGKGVGFGKKITQSVEPTEEDSLYELTQTRDRGPAKDIVKSIEPEYLEIDETMKEKFPDKNTDDSLEKELKYCKQLIDVIKGNEEICSYPKVQEKLKSTRRICH